MSNNNELTTEQKDTFWWRLVHLEPAIYKAVIVSVVTLLASLGIVIAPGIPDAIAGFIATIGTLVSALWVRSSVTANARVLVSVPDPVNARRRVMPGEATTTASSAAILAAAEDTPLP